MTIILVSVCVAVVGRYRVKSKRTTCRKAIASGVLITYILLILVATVFSRDPLSESFLLLSNRVDFNVLSTWSKKANAPLYVSTEPIFNVVMFIPIGFLLHASGKKAGIAFAIALSFSILIEMLQLLSSVGFFELSDIVSNAIGAVIGIMRSWALDRIKKEARRPNPQ